MKLIIAVFQCERLPDVQAALDMRQACRISIGQVASDVSNPEQWEPDRGAGNTTKESLLRLELAVMDGYVEGAVDAIFRHGYTEAAVQAGDVKIIVTPVTAGVLTLLAEEET